MGVDGADDCAIHPFWRGVVQSSAEAFRMLPLRPAASVFGWYEGFTTRYRAYEESVDSASCTPC